MDFEKAVAEQRERLLRLRHNENEKNRTGQATRDRYVNHILSLMPVQNGIQRMPPGSEFTKRLIEAYESISHSSTWQAELDWARATAEVRGILNKNQTNVIHFYVLQIKKAMHQGSTDIKAVWDDIAHYADRDDANLKSQIWSQIKGEVK